MDHWCGDPILNGEELKEKIAALEAMLYDACIIMRVANLYHNKDLNDWWESSEAAKEEAEKLQREKAALLERYYD